MVYRKGKDNANADGLSRDQVSLCKVRGVSGLTPLTDRLSPDQSDSPPPNWNKKTINYKMTGCIDNGHFKGPENADDVP